MTQTPNAASTPVPAAPDAEGADLADVHEQKAVRLAKRERLLAERTDAAGGAYPVAVPVTDTIAALRARYADLEAGAETGVTASVAGRVVFSRNTGKLCFASLQAGDGAASRRWCRSPRWARTRCRRGRTSSTSATTSR
jgi:lysyl-tRNA synthetase class 2